MKAWAVFLGASISSLLVYGLSQDLSKALACLIVFLALVILWPEKQRDIDPLDEDGYLNPDWVEDYLGEPGMYGSTYDESSRPVGKGW